MRISLPEYFRLPDGFIPVASPTILGKAVALEVPTVIYQLAYLVEPLDVQLFGREGRVRPEVGEDFLHQVADVADFEFKRFVRSIGSDEPAPP